MELFSPSNDTNVNRQTVKSMDKMTDGTAVFFDSVIHDIPIPKIQRGEM